MSSGITRITRSVTLKPGECFKLPTDGEIIYIDDPSSITSDCEVPQDFNVRCYRFAFENAYGENPQSDAVINGIIIDGVEETFAATVDYDSASVDTALLVQLNLLTSGTIFNASDCSNMGGSIGNIRTIFQSPGTDIYLKCTNPTGFNGVGGNNTIFYIKAEEITPCDCTGELV